MLRQGLFGPKFQVEGAVPTNHSSCQKTRMNNLSCGIRNVITSFFCFVTMHEFVKWTDGWTEKPSQYPRLHYMQSHSKMLCKRILVKKDCGLTIPIFSEHSCSLYVAVRLSVCLSSVKLVRPTQATEIFGNLSMSFGTLAIHDLSVKILRRSSQGNPSIGGVKHKRGSRI